MPSLHTPVLVRQMLWLLAAVLSLLLIAVKNHIIGSILVFFAFAFSLFILGYIAFDRSTGTPSKGTL
jgi:hypothetical protein